MALFLARAARAARRLSRQGLGLGLVTVVTVAACGDAPYFSDDEGGPRTSAAPLSAHPDELSQPYALATRVRIAVRGGEARADVGFRVTSDNPAILRVDRLVDDRESNDDPARAHLVAECTATGAGDTVLRLVDPAGREQRAASIQVRAPDGLRLLAHGPVRLLGRDASSAIATEVTELRVLSGGKGAFAVLYYQGQQRLYGRGILTARNPPQVNVENGTTSGVFVNEWLFVSPQLAGTYPLPLTSAMLPMMRTLREVPLIAVPPAEIAALRLDEEVVPDGGRKDDSEVWVLARATDRGGKEVHGVYASWTLDGAPQLGKDGDPQKNRGDLYRFRHQDGASRTLVATGAAPGVTARAERTIAARPGAGAGYVADTTYLGCAAPRRGAPPAPALLVSLPFLAALLRRRRAADRGIV